MKSPQARTRAAPRGRTTTRTRAVVVAAAPTRRAPGARARRSCCSGCSLPGAAGDADPGAVLLSCAPPAASAAWSQRGTTMASYQYIFTMKDLGKVYPGGKEVLKGLHLQ